MSCAIGNKSHDVQSMLIFLDVFFLKSTIDVWNLKDEAGKEMPALVVFSESLKYLKQSLYDEAKNQHTDITLSDIKWVVTVPAIWPDPAKSFMRKAAIIVRFLTL